MESNNIQWNITQCFKIYEEYSWLINCYVLDFFTENHWAKLKLNWRSNLENLTPVEIASLLTYDKSPCNRVWPLSLLALKASLLRLSLSRQMSHLIVKNHNFLKDPIAEKIFWKNVKAKKRHEISIMSQICYNSALETNCFYIVDIGAGLGHLSRLLNYEFGFRVCAIEAQDTLHHQAVKLDVEFEKMLKKKSKHKLKHQKTVHVNLKIEPNITISEFMTIVKTAFNVDSDVMFGIVGLHPCGDLAATLLKLYNECPNAAYINIVGCCYMKLSTTTPTQGFPLSSACKINKINLSYHSREIACHAIENYVDRLIKGECWRLKIHTYRAAIEKIITELEPSLQHSALNNVKYSEDLSFEDYCKKATMKLPLCIPTNQIKGREIESFLNQWQKVVVFYSLRLLFAPMIETIILLDRLLYVKQFGSVGKIISVFDSRISPRTHVLTAKKFGDGY